MKRNYKSDFDFFLRLKDCEGNVVPFPDYDWLARFYTDDNKANAYVASCIGGECKNCFNDGGQIHVVCDAHGLSAGKLKVEFHAQLPDEIYPDGRQLVVTPAPLDIELVREAGDCSHEDMSAELRQPVMRGADAGPLYCPLIKFDLANGTFSDGFTLDKDCTGPAREVWERFKKGFPSEIIIDVVDTDIKDWRERVSLFLDDHDIYSGSHTSNYYSAPFDYNGDVVGLLHIMVRHEEDDETVQFSRFDLRDEESRKATVLDLNLALRGKVDKVTGKGLSTNDFTDALKAKLEGLRNYDDTALNKEIDALEKSIDTLVGGSASQAIDTFNEIEAFLAGISDTSSLTKMLSDLRASVLEEIASQDMTVDEADDICTRVFGPMSGGVGG